MIIGITVAVVFVVLLIIVIWAILESHRVKKRLLALFLIGLVLFGFFSIMIAFKGKKTDLKSVPGIIEAFKVYFSWLSHSFTNLKTLTASAIKMDWKGNSSAVSTPVG